jgi:SAM-dependent methyltransferase
MTGNEELHRSKITSKRAPWTRYRPSYPPAAIDAILENLGRSGPLTAADVGAGTGISSRLLAERGVLVIAIEPAAEMRLSANLGPGVRLSDASATATGLPSSSVDIVLCAQSFHWFYSTTAIAEFARIMRAGGRLSLMWNMHDRGDPFTAKCLEQLLRGGDGTGWEAPAERQMMPLYEVVMHGGFFAKLEARTFPNAHRLDFEGLLGRVRSAAICHDTDDGRVRDIARALHAEHADSEGFVEWVYQTRLYQATRV